MSLEAAIQLETAFVSSRSQDYGAGRVLLQNGMITSWQFFYGLRHARIWRVSLTSVFIAKGWITASQAMQAWSKCLKVPVVDLDEIPPSATVTCPILPGRAIELGALAWSDEAGETVYAVSCPKRYKDLCRELGRPEGSVRFVLASDAQIKARLARRHSAALLKACEYRLDADFSCRNWGVATKFQKTKLAALFLVAFTATVLFPATMILTTLCFALLCQFVATVLKLCALFASRRRGALQPETKHAETLPKISVMVPLFKEKEIAQALIRRLRTIRYPRPLLEVILVLEEKDTVTRATLEKSRLPHWISFVTVPDSGGITTKPRALNYALDFCQGDIIGIWDAEDAPDPDQLTDIASQFHNADDDVACIQGVLDYYNPDSNWIARCFTLEYAIWFRIMLRGLSRMGFAVPLGGTTLFLRRRILEEIGRWDAHNVTEDADLGIRLARFGYRTQLSTTVTQEEANCRLVPWIQQRSRWLKGYIITYCVHMRHPLRLFRDLGAKKFLGFNALFLTTIVLFPLAPLIWSFWLLMFGLSDPLGLGGFSSVFSLAVGILLSSATGLDIVMACIGLRGQGRNHLMRWTPCFLIYFPLATIAAYKAIYELISSPFYWDKTAHGQTVEGQKASYSAVRL